MRHMLLVILAGATLPLFSAAAAEGRLEPNEVAVVAMAQSETSRRLAEYYAHARRIPKSQILLLPGKPTRNVGRAVWQHEIRPAIRDWLIQNNLQDKIRCFVTCWDVPLRIGRRDNEGPEATARKKLLAQSRAALVAKLDETIAALGSVAPAGDSPKEPSASKPSAEEPAADQTPRPETEVARLTAEFQAAFTAARTRVQKIEPADDRLRIGAALERAFVTYNGVSGLLQLVARHRDAANPDSASASRLQRLHGQLQGLSQGIVAIEAMPDMPERDMQLLTLARTAGGLVGALQWIDRQRQEIDTNETYSSFDSELSLLHWSDYPLQRWRPNVLHYGYDNAFILRPTTLMVARLEAPTYELAKGLIDTALAVEKTGLKGKVYLDARGIKFDPKKDKPGSYGQFDQSLRDLAERLKEHTELEVVLNEEATLFQPGDCPDAALYCGWYSLAKYVDAFDWRPGAVGYHMASSEATTLRTPGGKVWCNAMLEDGIAATLGPVHEPYLASFPLPDAFFGLLLTGNYTLVEAYYRTKPYNSWAMVLVGDPLYNPFKNNPQLSEDALPDRLKPKPPAASQR